MIAHNEIYLFNRNAAMGASGQWSLLLVCVDRFASGGKAVGRLYSCYQTDFYPFYGYTDLLLGANDLFDRLETPLAKTAIRSIQPQAGAQPPPKRAMLEQYDTLSKIAKQRGAAFDFCTSVRSRQNASWQGLLTLTNHTTQQMFCSRLELLYLLRAYQETCVLSQREAV